MEINDIGQQYVLTPEQMKMQQQAQANGQKVVYVVQGQNQNQNQNGNANNANANANYNYYGNPNNNNNNNNNGNANANYNYYGAANGNNNNTNNPQYSEMEGQIEGQGAVNNVNNKYQSGQTNGGGGGGGQMASQASNNGNNSNPPAAYGANSNNSNNSNNNNNNNNNGGISKYDDHDAIDRNIAVTYYQSQVYNNIVQPGMIPSYNENNYNNYNMDEKKNGGNNNNDNDNGAAKEECMALVDCLMNSDKDTNSKKRNLKMNELIKLSVPKKNNRKRRMIIISYYNSVVNMPNRTLLGDIWNNEYLYGTDESFRFLLQGLWMPLEEWLTIFFIDKFGRNLKLLKEKKGYWLDILCFMDGLLLRQVSSAMKKKDKQGRNLAEFFSFCMDAVHLDKKSSFAMLINQLCAIMSDSDIAVLMSDETKINSSITELVRLHKKHDKTGEKEKWIELICQYRFCDSQILRNIIIQFKNQSKMGNKKIDKYFHDKFDNTGNALATLVDYHVNENSDILARKVSINN